MANKILVLALALLTAVSFSACGGDDDSSSSDTTAVSHSADGQKIIDARVGACTDALEESGVVNIDPCDICLRNKLEDNMSDDELGKALDSADGPERAQIMKYEDECVAGVSADGTGGGSGDTGS
jgi:hypothetical protein